MILYTVVPCYNEEEVLPETVRILSEKYASLIKSEKISSKSRILFVDDGSSDKTWELIESCHKKEPIFCGVKLSRNRGHQNALLAGLMTAKEFCDAAVSIDADLQDDVNVIDEMIEKYESGCDIVYGVREKRKSDSFLKRFTAESYYKLLRFLGADTLYNHADFRLMSKRALDALENFDEVNLFLRGMIPMIGYKSGTVSYERHERLAGESKYTLSKMLELGWNGITSCSIRPIEMILGGGIFLSGTSLFVMLILLILSVVGVLKGFAGWILASIFLCCGIQLTAIGVVGEYVGKTYFEAKHRPKYVIEEKIL